MLQIIISFGLLMDSMVFRSSDTIMITHFLSMVRSTMIHKVYTEYLLILTMKQLEKYTKESNFTAGIYIS